jgi:formiminotetrahydrofolate cyclodeaminase
MSDHLSMTLTEYLERAAAGTPTPGGGSVAALAGALGAAMASMAGNFTAGRRKFAAVEAETRELLAVLDRAGATLRRLVQTDTEAYGAVSQAFALPRATDDEKRARRSAVAAACRGAMAVPLEAVRACRAALAASERLAVIANPRLISDVGVAAILLEAAARAAALNVQVNLPQIDDDAAAAEAGREVGGLLEECTAFAQQACGTVAAALSKGAG